MDRIGHRNGHGFEVDQPPGRRADRPARAPAWAIPGIGSKVPSAASGRTATMTGFRWWAWTALDRDRQDGHEGSTQAHLRAQGGEGVARACRRSRASTRG